ncbi:hypothetical protein LY76DRAFT_380095, partial [Colletotrichum caudatum]
PNLRSSTATGTHQCQIARLLPFFFFSFFFFFFFSFLCNSFFNHNTHRLSLFLSLPLIYRPIPIQSNLLAPADRAAPPLRFNHKRDILPNEPLIGLPAVTVFCLAQTIYHRERPDPPLPRCDIHPL